MISVIMTGQLSVDNTAGEKTTGKRRPFIDLV